MSLALKGLNKEGGGGGGGETGLPEKSCLLHLWLRVMVTLHLWSAIYWPPIAGAHLVAGSSITGVMRLMLSIV